MAKISPIPPISNTLGDYSVYKMQGVDKLVIRLKHGPNKEQLKTGKNYEKFRLRQSEFGCASKVSTKIQQALFGIKHLKDFTFGGMLVKICILMQKEETGHPLGTRPVLLSQRGSILNGFNLNKKNPFDVVVKSPVTYTFDRSEAMAKVVLPKLHPGVNFANPGQWPLFRFIIGLGGIQDMVYNGSDYVTSEVAKNLNSRQVQTGWHSSDSIFKSMPLEVKLNDNAILDEGTTLLLSIGIEFGRMISDGIIEGVKRGGCGKILGLG